MTRHQIAGLTSGLMLLYSACSSKDASLQTRDAGRGGDTVSGATGGAAGPGTGGIVVVGSAGAMGLGSGGEATTGTGGAAGVGGGGRFGVGTGGDPVGGAAGGRTGLGTGGGADAGGHSGTGAGGRLGAGGSTGVPPVACSLVTTLAGCEARNDCHSVFQDPHNCKCPTVGCCAQFSRCVDGDQAQCTAGPGIACDAATPYCEGSYVVAYTKTCFEGCVQSKDCAPSDSIPCGMTTCGPQQACVHPPVGGACLMPDAGQCPAGTSPMGSPPCCLPPDNPTCVTIDRPCNAATVSCSCFTVDPCNAHLTNACAASTIVGRDIQCRGA